MIHWSLMALFKVTRSLLGRDESQEHFLDHCEDYYCYLGDKVARIHLELASKWTVPVEVLGQSFIGLSGVNLCL